MNWLIELWTKLDLVFAYKWKMQEFFDAVAEV